ncbi:MAG: exopolysaccharide biosynthesis protein [Candidatus Rokubacteria bacterium]|nr:exopolysaccharide biosynthesis protein [Candidatus Rokubacteria bacterium]
MSGIEFRDSDRKLSATLAEVAERLPPGSASLRDLIALSGEQGLLLLCALLTLPFLLPVSVPGMSTVFGAAIILIGVGVTLNRVPWLPRRIRDRSLPTAQIKAVFERGARIVARFEHLIRPRWLVLTRGATINGLHGMALILAGVLLIAPLGLIPFSNTLPGFAILFLSLGLLQRDGAFILAGYALTLATIVYFGMLAVGAVMAGQGILSLMGR